VFARSCVPVVGMGVMCEWCCGSVRKGLGSWMSSVSDSVPLLASWRKNPEQPQPSVAPSHVASGDTPTSSVAHGGDRDGDDGDESPLPPVPDSSSRPASATTATPSSVMSASRLPTSPAAATSAAANASAAPDDGAAGDGSARHVRFAGFGSADGAAGVDLEANLPNAQPRNPPTSPDAGGIPAGAKRSGGGGGDSVLSRAASLLPSLSVGDMLRSMRTREYTACIAARASVCVCVCVCVCVSEHSVIPICHPVLQTSLYGVLLRWECVRCVCPRCVPAAVTPGGAAAPPAPQEVALANMLSAARVLSSLNIEGYVRQLKQQRVTAQVQYEEAAKNVSKVWYACITRLVRKVVDEVCSPHVLMLM